MEKYKGLIKNFINSVLRHVFRIGNIILFESVPSVSDNAEPVFREFLKRGVNEKIKLIWVILKSEDADAFKKEFSGVKNVDFIKRNSFAYNFYYLHRAKAFVVSNLFLDRSKPEQLYFDLSHGGALKDCSDTYNLPHNCRHDSYVMTLSEYTAQFDAESFKCDLSCTCNLGYPRNDALFEKYDTGQLFKGDYDSIICWMPTYRQHSGGGEAHSNISFPIIDSPKTAEKINDCCVKNNILIVVKPHPSQNLSLIRQKNLSNLVFVDNSFFEKNGINYYTFLGNCDALLTDYSTVYYDYLLCDKPIGLCWDDFDEYNRRVGFSVDVDLIFSGGEKLYTAEDLCCFVERVSANEDVLSIKRNEIKELIHDHIDNKSTERIVDFILGKTE